MAETKEKKEPVKYRFGQNDIDLDHYIYNLGTNVQSYVDSQGWNDGQKQEFMNSYNRYMQGLQDQLNNGTNRFSTNDFGAILDSSGEFSDQDNDSDSGDYYYDKDGKQIDSAQYGDLKKRKQKKYQTFSANKAVATYFNKVGKAVIKNPKKSESTKKEKFNVSKHGFLADWQRRNNASGEKMDLKLESENCKLKVRANAVILHDGKVLVCSMNDNGFWCCPGGHIRLGEDSKTAVLREAYEEVGIHFDDAKLLLVMENFFEGKKQKRFHEISFYYLMEGKIPVEKLQDYSFNEHEGEKTIHFEFKWVDVNELDTIDMRPANLKDKLKLNELKLEHSIRFED